MKKRLVIVGGGPGGYVAAIRAAQLGADVHLAERERLGGTCLNVGCVPTKALLHTAELYDALKEEAKRGLVVGKASVDWPGLMAHKEKVVNRLVAGVAGLLRANKIAVHQGQAVLRDAHTVEIIGAKPASIQADIIVLAAGSVPQRLPVPGTELAGVLDSTAALSLGQIPKSLIIIGGGVIGTEFAALYCALGTDVTVVEMLPQILPPVDGQIADAVKRHLSQKGVKFYTDARLQAIKKTADGLAAIVQQGEKQYEFTGENVLIATGRVPNTDGLGLDAAGIKTDRGKILTDGNFATNVPSIYAIGDCNGRTMLAHAASAQGVAAAQHALGHRAFYNHRVIPACIYTSPEVASVGLTEEQAASRGTAYKVGLFPLTGNGKALIEGCEAGLVKVIADEKYGEILGVHIFGPRATEMIAEAALAMNLEATVDELISTIHAHPTVSEAIAEAGLNVGGNAIHWPPGASVR